MKRTIKRLLLARDNSHDWLESLYFTGEVTSKFNNLNEIKNLPGPRKGNKNQQYQQMMQKRQKQPDQIASMQADCKVLKIKSQRLNTQNQARQKEKESKNARCRTMPDELAMKQVQRKFSSHKTPQPKQLCRAAKPTHSKKHSIGSKTNVTLPTNIQQSQQVMKNNSKKDVKPISNHEKSKTKTKPKTSTTKSVMGAKKRFSEQIGRRDQIMPRLILAQRNIIKSFVDYSELPSLSSRNQQQKKKYRSLYETSDYFNSADLKALAQMKLDYQDENISRPKSISSTQFNQTQQNAATVIQKWWRRVRTCLISKQYKHIFNGFTKNTVSHTKPKPFFSNAPLITNLQIKQTKVYSLPILSQPQPKIPKIDKDTVIQACCCPGISQKQEQSQSSSSIIHIESSRCAQDCCCFFCSQCQQDKPVIRLIKVVDSRRQRVQFDECSDCSCVSSQIQQCNRQCQIQDELDIRIPHTGKKQIYSNNFNNFQPFSQGQVENIQNESINEFIRESLMHASLYVSGMSKQKDPENMEKSEMDRPLSQIFNDSFNPLSQSSVQLGQCKDTKKEILAAQIEDMIFFEFLNQIHNMIEKLTGKCKAGLQSMIANEMPAWRINQNEQIQAYLAQLFQQVTSSQELLDHIELKLKQRMQGKENQSTLIIPYDNHLSARDLIITFSILRQELPLACPDFTEKSSPMLRNEHLLECMFICINQMLEVCSSSLHLYNGRVHYFPSVSQLLQLSMEHTITLTQLRIDMFEDRMCMDLMQWVRNDKQHWTHSNLDSTIQVKQNLEQWIYETLLQQFAAEFDHIIEQVDRSQNFLSF